MLRTSIAIVLALGVASAHAADKPRLAVLNVQTTGLDKDLVPLLTGVLTVEIDSLHRFDVVSGDDIQTMLNFEKQKDLAGCDDASCIAAIAGALGVEQVVATNIGRLGETYVVNIKLIDIRHARTQSRVYETVRGEVDLLIEKIKTSVHKLFADQAPPTAAVTPPPARDPAVLAAPRAQGTPTTASPAPAAPPSGHTATAEVSGKTAQARTPATRAPAATSAPSTAPGAAPSALGVTKLLGGVTGAFLAVGAVSGFMTLRYRTQADTATEVGSQTAIASGKTARLITNVSLGLAAATGVATVLVWRNQRAHAGLAPMVVSQGAGGAVWVSF